MTMFGSPPVPDWLQQPDAAMPPVNVAPSMMQTGQVKQKRGGMFGSGLNAGEVIVNLLNGALAAQGNPVGMANIKMMQDAYREKQQQAQEAAQYQQRRQDSLVDYEAKQKIDQQYPTAPQPTEYERLLQSRGIMPGSDAYNQHLDAYLKVRENPTQYIPGVGLVQMGGAAPSGPPPQAIEHLKANPSLKGAFDQKYGPGAADRILGGGGPSPSGSGDFQFSF